MLQKYSKDSVLPSSKSYVLLYIYSETEYNREFNFWSCEVKLNYSSEVEGVVREGLVGEGVIGMVGDGLRVHLCTP